MIGRRRSANGAARELEMLAERPLVSVVMPTHDTEPRHLGEAMASLRASELPELGALHRR